MIRIVKIIVQVIFWLLYTSIVIQSVYMDKQWNFDDPAIYFPLALNYLWIAIAFYLFYFLLHSYFEKRKWFRYLFLSLLSSTVLTCIFIPIHAVITPRIDFFTLEFILGPFLGTFITTQAGSLIRGFGKWLESIQEKSDLENKSLKMELELLKSQINPHFLFNTLNNIDAQIKTNPDGASSSLIKVSDILRYMLYEIKSDKVQLEDELNNIKKIIDLHMLRHKKDNYISFHSSSDSSQVEVAPMLFLSFIENAFKYACSLGKYPVIDIIIEHKEKHIKFTCSNYYNYEVTNFENGGIGIKNVKRRLEILYPNKHSLTTEKSNNIFKVSLIINVS